MLAQENIKHFFQGQEEGYGPYAAIDLGSNTCRLLIAGRVGNHLETIESFSRFTRLGQGISSSQTLSEAAIKRTRQALSLCASKLRSHKPLAMRAVATEAVRRALNKEAFISYINQTTGILLEIISQEEEALLALKGCANLLSDSHPYALVFDIGGGSTEIMWIHRAPSQVPKLVDWISLPFGVVTLAEDYKTDQASDYKEIRETTYSLLEDFTARNNIRDYIMEDHVQILGTSCTATTALAIHQGLKRYEKSKIDGFLIEYSDLYKVIKNVQMMSKQERNYNRCIGTSRGDLVLGGLAILEGICNLWPIGVMRVADRGVREGIAAELAFGKDSYLGYKPYDNFKDAA